MITGESHRYYGPVHFSGTLYFQGDSKADRKEEKICGEKEINSFPFCSYLRCCFPGVAHRANRRKNAQPEYLQWGHI